MIGFYINNFEIDYLANNFLVLHSIYMYMYDNH